MIFLKSLLFRQIRTRQVSIFGTSRICNVPIFAKVDRDRRKFCSQQNDVETVRLDHHISKHELKKLIPAEIQKLEPFWRSTKNQRKFFAEKIQNNIHTQERAESQESPMIVGDYSYYHDSSSGWSKWYREKVGSCDTTETSSVLVDTELLSAKFGESMYVTGLKISTDHTYLSYSYGPAQDSMYVDVLYLGDNTSKVVCALQGVKNMELGGVKDQTYLYYTTTNEKGRPDRIFRRLLKGDDLKNTNVDLMSNRIIAGEGKGQGQRQEHEELLIEEKDDRFFLDISRTKNGRFITLNSHSKTCSDVKVVETIVTSNPITPGFMPTGDFVLPSFVYSICPRKPGFRYFVEHVHRPRLDGASFESFFVLICQDSPSADFKLMIVPTSSITSSSPSNLEYSKDWKEIPFHSPHSLTSTDQKVEKGKIKIEDIDVFQDYIVIFGRSQSTGLSTVSFVFFDDFPFLFQLNEKGVSPMFTSPPDSNDAVIKSKPISTNLRKEKKEGQENEDEEQTLNEHKVGTSLTDDTITDTFWASKVNHVTLPYKHGQINPSPSFDPKSDSFSFSLSTPFIPFVTCTYNTLTRSMTMENPLMENHVEYMTQSCDVDVNEKIGCADCSFEETNGDFVIKTIFATNCTKDEKDIQIPITVMHKKSIILDGSNPLLCIGYGAYGEILHSNYSAERLTLLEEGWVIALCHVRGDGDLGSKWHTDGNLSKKKNGLSDFAACISYLQQDTSSANSTNSDTNNNSNKNDDYNKGQNNFSHCYSQPQLTVINGTSAGGLVCGHICNSYAHLVQCATFRSPFLDVLWEMTNKDRYLTQHEYDEWGDPADPVVFEYMKSYSPCENIPSLLQGQEASSSSYPDVFITTSLNDPVVPFYHSANFVFQLRNNFNNSFQNKNRKSKRRNSHRVLTKAAIMQSAHPPNLLLHAKEGSGHSLMHIDDVALEFAFMYSSLNLSIPTTTFISKITKRINGFMNSGS